MHGVGPLTVANGGAAQADVLTRPRQAADAVGATKCHRPEWVAVNESTRDVYVSFTNGSGIVARQCTRVVMAARGLDPDLLTVPEMGLDQLGRPAYVDAVRRYMTGTPEGVAAWIRFVCTSVSYGAAAADLTLVDIREKGLGKAVEEE